MVLILKEFSVEGVLIVLENVQSEPCSAHWPDSSWHPQILRSGVSPYIGVVVADKALVDTVHFLSCYLSVFTDSFEQVEQRQVALGERTAFGRPVVHLDVDVYGVTAAPCRPHILVPDTLKVRGLSSGTAARDKEVSAKVEVQFDKLVVVYETGALLIVKLIASETGYALIGREGGDIRFAVVIE